MTGFGLLLGLIAGISFSIAHAHGRLPLALATAMLIALVGAGSLYLGGELARAFTSWMPEAAALFFVGSVAGALLPHAFTFRGRT
ncbi:MAG: hypothetical protein WC050_03075 [Candidatus Paceibacterota bacterium]